MVLLVIEVICMRVVTLLRIPVTEKVAKNDYRNCHNQNNAKCPRGLHGPQLVSALIYANNWITL